MTGRVLFMAMESCWLAALALAVDAAIAAPSQQAALWACVLLYPLAYMASSAARRFAGSSACWLLCAGSLLAFIAAAALLPAGPAGEGSLHDRMLSAEYKRFLVTAVVIMVAWLRGWRLAGRKLESREVATSFQIGLVALLSAVSFPQAKAVQPLLALAIGFFVLALLALWHARTYTEDALAQGPRLDLALLALAIVLGAGLSLAAMVDRAALEPVLAIPAWLWQELTQSLRSVSELMPEVPQSADQPRTPAGRAPAQEAPPWVLPLFALLREHEVILGVLAYLALLAAGIGVLMHYRTRWLPRARRAPGIIYQRSSTSLRDALMALWGSMRAGVTASVWQVRKSWAGLLASRDTSVRGTYRWLLRRMARKGWARALHESPEEYQRRVLAAWPGAPQALEALTAAFVADRYGRRRIDPQGVRNALPQLRSQVRKMRRK